VGTLRGQSNTITRRIDISLPYQARLRPHAPLESIVTQVLRFMPDPQSARHLMREKVCWGFSIFVVGHNVKSK
jgi:hypothetical protein